MSEFNNRIDAQREILTLVNSRDWKEELYGLSSGAIDRWIRINGIDPSGDLPKTIQKSARTLFFLANKSQEQVTDEYRLISVEVFELTQKISRVIDLEES